MTESAEVFVASTASAPQTPLELGEELLLRGELLDDRLDHEVAAGEIRELGRQREPPTRRRGVCSSCPFSTLRVRKCVDPVARLLCELDGDLAADGVEAGLDAELRDTRAHRAQADDADLLISRATRASLPSSWARAARSRAPATAMSTSAAVSPTPRARKPIAGPLTTPPV